MSYAACHYSPNSGLFSGDRGHYKVKDLLRNSPEASSPHLHQGRASELQKWQNIPKNVSCGTALVMKALEHTTRFAVLSVLRGFRHNTHRKLNGSLIFFTDHTKKCCALLEAAFSSFNQCTVLGFFSSEWVMSH